MIFRQSSDVLKKSSDGDDLIITSLDLPPETRVDQQMPTKLLVENGGLTAADKRQMHGPPMVRRAYHDRQIVCPEFVKSRMKETPQMGVFQQPEA